MTEIHVRRSRSSHVCRILEWDSAFWGFPVGRVQAETLSEHQLEQVDAWCSRQQVRCIYFLARADDPETSCVVEDGGFRFVDIRLTLSRSAPGAREGSWSHQPGGLSVRSSRAEDMPRLRCIAREIHHDTRFYFDKNFPSPGADLLYETWLQRSCDGYADAVFVADLSGAPIGYITCHLSRAEDKGSIGLLGIDGPARGRGAGQALVQTALDWFATHGVQEVDVVTQGRNTNAQRLYQHHGFRTRYVQLWYHKWYSGSGARTG